MALEKSEIVETNNELTEKRSPLFKKRNVSKADQSLKFLTDFILMVPGLAESVSFETKYVVDMSADISRQLADGTLQLLTKASGGFN